MHHKSSETLEISVLIPVYNYDVRLLVENLCQQLQSLACVWEIRCYDDGSTEDFKAKNALITKHKNLIYKELENNIGRSRIRNKLATEAKYSWLLFMDCDSGLPDAHYIQRYWDTTLKYTNTQVFIGGTIYERPLSHPNFSLRWHYGIQREEIAANIRQQFPYDKITLNNMLITRDLYLKNPLDETLTTYGHEDTKFGFELKKQVVNILHIENPVLHLGLESNEIFLNKTQTAALNFYKISTQQQLGQETKLYKAFAFLQKTGTSYLFLCSYELFKPLIINNLISEKPKIILLDLLKLYTLLKAAHNSNPAEK